MNFSQLGFKSSKTYEHNLGLSVCFRQPKADSHCNKLHGYSLKIKFEFSATELDKTNWVVDFGSMKSLKAMLEDDFDHKTIVAEDDPEMEWFREAEKRGIVDLIVYPKVGMEMFSYYIYQAALSWLESNGYADRVQLDQVTVWEHPANSASYGII